MVLENRKYIIGPRKVSGYGKSRVIVYLPPDFRFLRGKKVYVTLEVWEPPETKEKEVEA